jgi:hypothetical protein
MKRLLNWFVSEGFVVNLDFDYEIRASIGAVAIRINRLQNGYMLSLKQITKEGDCQVIEKTCRTSNDVIGIIKEKCIFSD